MILRSTVCSSTQRNSRSSFAKFKGCLTQSRSPATGMRNSYAGITCYLLLVFVPQNVLVIHQTIKLFLDKQESKKLLYYFIMNFYQNIVALQCCVNFCFAANRISHTYTCIPLFLDFLPVQVTAECGVEFPVLYSRFLPVFYFIHSGV